MDGKKQWNKTDESRIIDILKADSYNNLTSRRNYYYIKNTYKLVCFDGVTKVARISDGRIMATEDNVLTIIHNMHIATGHKGEKKTYKKVAELYGNITMAAVKKFISECERCAEKSRNMIRKGIVVRPITVNDLNQRGQVDLVDFQSLPDGNYRFILHYQEHLTKYSFLRPLTSKKAVEVAKELFNIFLDFGAPHILQSDNGREFTGEIIKELKLLWPNLLLINGRPRYPQSQGSVERSNSTLKNSLIAWMRDNKTNAWSLGLRIVQWGMNTTYHEAIKMDPYNAMFGQKARMSLSSVIPQEFLIKISNGIFEEDIEHLLEPEEKIVVNEPTEHMLVESNGDQIILEYNPDVLEEFSKSGVVVENESISTENIVKEIATSDNIAVVADHPAKMSRELACKNLLIQANKMIKRSKKQLGTLKVGDNVLISISQFDRGRGDPANLIGVVVEVKDGKYKVGTKNGIINSLLERNCLQATKYSKLTVKEVPEEEKSLRELVRLDSVGSGQGYQRCSCVRDCTNNRCKCFKNKYVCNSACHSGKSCKNHD